MRPYLGLVLLALACQAAVASDQAAPVEAKTTFLTRCSRCHQPPDPNLAVDRAWLDQVRRTA